MKFIRDGVKIHVNPRYCLIATPLLIGAVIYLILGTDAVTLFSQVAATLISREDVPWLLIVCATLSGMIAMTCWVRHLTKRAYRKLIRQLKQRAQHNFKVERQLFVDRLDHEMKNSLQVITSGANTLAALVETDSPEEKLVHNIDVHANQLRSIFGDMRTLATVERSIIEPKAIEVEPLLARVFREAEQQPNAKNRRMKKVVSRFGSFSRVQGDEALLATALRNLLDNALKYSRDYDTIELRAFKSRGEVVIQVADTGPGIEQDDFQNIWKQLWRGAQTRAIPGSGMGLALVRTIVDKHQGYISLESEPEIGTEFTIYLPV